VPFTNTASLHIFTNYGNRGRRNVYTSVQDVCKVRGNIEGICSDIKQKFEFYINQCP
jgi:hypothetical protein